MNIKGYFSTIKGKINTVFIAFLVLCSICAYTLYMLHFPVDKLREAKLKTQKSLKILNDLTFNGQKVIHHESKFKRNFTQKIEDFEHAVLEIADLRNFNQTKTNTTKHHLFIDKIFSQTRETTPEEVLLGDILDSWKKVKKNFLLIRDQNTYKDSIIISYDPEVEYLLDENYQTGNSIVETSTNVIFKKHVHHLSTLNPALKKAWEYDDIYSQGLKNQLEKLFQLYKEQEHSQEASFDQYLTVGLIIISIYIIFVGLYLHKAIYTPLSAFQSNSLKAFDNIEYLPLDLQSKELKNIQNFILKQQDQINIASKYIESITSDDQIVEDTKVEGKLVEALATMRQKIEAVRKEENIRNWETRGLAEFSEILRTENKNIEGLTEKLIHKFVMYLNAAQGAIFLKEKVHEGLKLSLMSSYAYNRKKYLNKRIELGEGLVGQVWQEGAPVYLSNVPEKHFSLKSGLSQGTPKYIFIAPIKDADEVYGVIELASLYPFESYERAFVEQVSITIASSISSVQLSEQTNLLLEQAQDMTQQMQLHEEEMRQNMEELQATQEDTARREKEKQEELHKLKEQLNNKDQQWRSKLELAEQEIALLQEKITHAVVDNDIVKELKLQIEQLKKDFQTKETDLQETIKIKDMRIEKLRKKLNSN